jgi:TonB-dependent SusC/RagA subfamily outer membrane receptor
MKSVLAFILLLIHFALEASSLDSKGKAAPFVYSGDPTIKVFDISGKVTDARSNDGIGGVNVVIKGTSNGTTTDLNGDFFLTGAEPESTLIFSFVGYQAQEIKVSARTVINVTLKEERSIHSPSVVTGYRQQYERDITGSVVTIEKKDLLFNSSANLAQALQGKLAGVTIGNDNSPGGEAMIRIRGFGSPVDSSPLLVMDGVVVHGNLSTLNPNDIQSVSVLKDGVASAVYGSRGSNGVVIITTKNGVYGKPVLTYDFYYGVQQNPTLPEMLNTEQLAELIWESRINSGMVSSNGNPSHTQYGNGTRPVIPDYIFPGGAFEGDPRVSKDPTGEYLNYSTDIDHADFNKTRWLITKANQQGTNWLDEIYNRAPLQNHQLGISGASESSRYAVSLNYFDQQGIMDHTNFKRYSMRVNTQFNIHERLKIGENFQFAYGQSVEQPGGNSSDENPIIQAYRADPIIPVYDVSNVNFAGNRGVDLGGANNPVAALWRNKDNAMKEVRLFGNVFIDIDILKDLTARTSLGIDYSAYNQRMFSARAIEAAEAAGSNSLTTSNQYDWMLTWYNTLHYGVSFGENHHVDFLVGVESIKSRQENFSASRSSFATDDLDNRYLSGGTGTQFNSGSGSSWALRSEFAKVNYSLLGKYLLEGTVQREKTSLLPSSQRSAVSPALGIGWIFTEESFAENLPWLNYGKLRAGWGRNSSQTNIGMDAQVWNGKIAVSLDWYTRRNANIFPAPAGYYITYGYFVKSNWPGLDTLSSPLSPVYPQPLGTTYNRGIDLMLKYYGSAGASGLRYTIGLNFSSYKNRIEMAGAGSVYTGFGNEKIANIILTQSNQPISAFSGYTIEGIFQSDAEAQAAAVSMLGTNQNRAGRFKYKDINNDAVINSADIGVIGNPHPDFSYGLMIDVTYKNFGLTLFGQGVYGNDIFNYVKYWTDFPSGIGNRSKRMLENSWRPGNPNASLPQLSTSDLVSALPSTYYIENGSYFRMKNIQVSYNIPQLITSKIGLSGARIFIQTQNLFTITNYSGLDPEVNLQRYTAGYDRQIGVDGGVYPAAKQYMVGVNVKF